MSKQSNKQSNKETTNQSMSQSNKQTCKQANNSGSNNIKQHKIKNQTVLNIHYCRHCTHFLALGAFNTMK
jgi:hypothetical protein